MAAHPDPPAEGALSEKRERHTIFLRPATAAALERYALAHRDRYPSPSQAADALLERALARAASEAAEELLVPALRRVVRETVREEVAGLARDAGREQADRLAALLGSEEQRNRLQPSSP